jgi:hypothetical protein
MKRRLMKVQERFRSNWMARRTSIQIIPVRYGILFSSQPTMNLNKSEFGRRRGF